MCPIIILNKYWKEEYRDDAIASNLIHMKSFTRRSLFYIHSINYKWSKKENYYPSCCAKKMIKKQQSWLTQSSAKGALYCQATRPMKSLNRNQDVTSALLVCGTFKKIWLHDGDGARLVSVQCPKQSRQRISQLHYHLACFCFDEILCERLLYRFSCWQWRH